MEHTIQLTIAGKLTGGRQPSNATVKAGAGTHPTFNVDIPLQGGGQLLLEKHREKVSTKTFLRFVPLTPNFMHTNTSPLGGLHLAGTASSFPPVESACYLARLSHWRVKASGQVLDEVGLGGY
jgi:hypothetical protein